MEEGGNEFCSRLIETKGDVGAAIQSAAFGAVTGVAGAVFAGVASSAITKVGKLMVNGARQLMQGSSSISQLIKGGVDGGQKILKSSLPGLKDMAKSTSNFINSMGKVNSKFGLADSTPFRYFHDNGLTKASLKGTWQGRLPPGEHMIKLAGLAFFEEALDSGSQTTIWG